MTTNQDEQPEPAHDGPAGEDDANTTADPAAKPAASDAPADPDGSDDHAH